MMRRWVWFVVGWLVILTGIGLAYSVQTSGGVKVDGVRYESAGGQTISALLYVPENATVATPAPGILAIHGYINSKEAQSGFAIEFARRGYVVLTPDQTGHGYSDGPAFSEGFGGPASLAYLRSLDMVDPDNIGLEGHSMGGWAVLAAASVLPDGYKAMVLQGSSTGAPFAADGTPDWPRNLALVFSEFDEFSELMWGPPRAGDVEASAKLQALFGVGEPVTAGLRYGSVADGTARVLYQPPVTHPGNHISRVAIGHATDWFAETLEGGAPLAASNQVWMFKELGTCIALIGFVLLLLGTMQGLLGTAYLNTLAGAPENQAFTERTGKWWAMACLSAALPVATFYPLFKLSEKLLPSSALFPQLITTQVAVWAVLNGVLAAIMARVAGARVGVSRRVDILPAVLLALAVTAIGYLAVWLAGALAHVDFRIWFVAVKPLSIDQARIALVYLVPIFGYFWLSLSALHNGLSVSKDGKRAQYAANIGVLAGGFILFLIAQYGSLFMTGRLLTPAEPLNTIIMLQFVPLMVIVAVVSTYCWRRTGAILPGALVNTLFVTWYVVAGQATQYPAV